MSVSACPIRTDSRRTRISDSGATSPLSAACEPGLSAGEAPARCRRDVFVEPDDGRILCFLARCFRLEGRHALRRHLVDVLVLDLLEPVGPLGRLRFVDLDAPDLQ